MKRECVLIEPRTPLMKVFHKIILKLLLNMIEIYGIVH